MHHWAVPFLRYLDQIIKTIFGRHGGCPLEDGLDSSSTR